MKYTIKILVLTVVFVLAILFFGSNMDEVMFGIEKSTEMAESSLPTVALRSDGVSANRLFGFTSPMDVFSIRENIVAVENDGVVELLITENEADVRKVYYEVYDIKTQKKIADGTINALEWEGDEKVARIKIDEELKSSTEYAVEVMLIDSNSRRIHYYFRVKYYENSCYAEKISFIYDLSAWARTKNYNAIIPYLESTYRGDGSTYSFVDIKDSFHMVCWGDLQPKLLTRPVLTVSEVYSNICVGTLEYMVEQETDTGTERFYITEKFRVIVTDTAKHLLNYERTMEAAFDASLASVSKNQFKFGVTNETDTEFLTNTDSTMTAFVRNKELWHYNITENRLSRVFSLRHEDEAVSGLSCENYDVRILNLYENGDVSFMVYGYMGRGAYEGKTGILLYRYYRGEDRIEEMLYLPINMTFQQINQELGSFSYMSEVNVFYFMAQQTLYAYNMNTGEMHIISDRAKEDSVVFAKEEGFVTWQEDYDKVNILYLETAAFSELTPPEGEFIRVLGQIDQNIICSYGKLTDLAVSGDGEQIYPAYRVELLTGTGESRKTYQKAGYYVVDAEASENSIRLSRMEKKSGGRYENTEDDYILNSFEQENRTVTLQKRVTELMFDEYYIALPSKHPMKTVPKAANVPHTVIAKDTTVRIQALEEIKEEYRVHSFGEIVLLTENCTEAIIRADQSRIVGSVIDAKGRVIWERGVKFSAYYLDKRPGISCEESGLTSRQAAVQLMAAYLGYEINGAEFTAEDTMKDFLRKHTGEDVLTLSGITLDEALYFVYRGVPLYAMKNGTDAVVITGYSAATVTMYDPKEGMSKVVNLEEAKEMFLNAGNIFVSFVP